MKISACMIVKNEENNIERCLESIVDKVDEIVLIDTGSTDRTVQLAKKYTDKIYYFEWNDNFSEARNYSISKATGDWILIIDADEELVEERDGQIKKILEKCYYKGINTVIIDNLNFLTFDLKNYDEFKLPRFFRNGKIKYQFKVHNQPIYDSPSVFVKDLEIYHYGYLWSGSLKKKKINRSYPLVEDEMKVRESTKGQYYFYYFGQKLKLNLIANNYYLFFKNVKGKEKKITDYIDKYPLNVEVFNKIIEYSIVLKNSSKSIILSKGFYNDHSFNIDLSGIIARLFYNKNEFDKSIKYYCLFIDLLYIMLKEKRKYVYTSNYKVIFKNLTPRILKTILNKNISLDKKVLEKIQFILKNEELDYINSFYLIYLMKYLDKNSLIDSFLHEELNLLGNYKNKVKNKNKVTQVIRLLFVYFKEDLMKLEKPWEYIEKHLTKSNKIVLICAFEELIEIEGNLIYKFLKRNEFNSKVIDLLFRYFDPFITFKMGFRKDGLKKLVENKELFLRILDPKIYQMVINEMDVTGDLSIDKPFSLSVILGNSEFYKKDSKVLPANFLFEEELSPEFTLINSFNTFENLHFEKIKLLKQIFKNYSLESILKIIPNYLNYLGLNLEKENISSSEIKKEWEDLEELFNDPLLPAPFWSVIYLNENEIINKNKYLNENDQIEYIVNPSINELKTTETPLLSIYRDKNDFLYKEDVVEVSHNLDIYYDNREENKKIVKVLEDYFDLNEHDFYYNIAEKRSYGFIVENSDGYYPEIEVTNFMYENAFIFLPEYSNDFPKMLNIIEEFSGNKVFITYKNKRDCVFDSLSNFYIKPKFFLKKGYKILNIFNKYNVFYK
jgi:glycosyltransferase involved in cell wall biosynthesis